MRPTKEESHKAHILNEQASSFVFLKAQLVSLVPVYFQYLLLRGNQEPRAPRREHIDQNQGQESPRNLLHGIQEVLGLRLEGERLRIWGKGEVTSW